MRLALSSAASLSPPVERSALTSAPGRGPRAARAATRQEHSPLRPWPRARRSVMQASPALRPVLRPSQSTSLEALRVLRPPARNSLEALQVPRPPTRRVRQPRIGARRHTHVRRAGHDLLLQQCIVIDTGWRGIRGLDGGGDHEAVPVVTDELARAVPERPRAAVPPRARARSSFGFRRIAGTPIGVCRRGSHRSCARPVRARCCRA